MIKVAGTWEKGWNIPLLEADLWEYPLRDFGVHQHYMHPVSGIDRTCITEFATMEQILEENQDMTIVWVDETGETPLKDFVHPADNVLYITGRTTYRPMVMHKKPGDLSIRIETSVDGSNQAMLWAHQAMAIVLYDRVLKSWQ